VKGKTGSKVRRKMKEKPVGRRRAGDHYSESLSDCLSIQDRALNKHKYSVGRTAGGNPAARYPNSRKISVLPGRKGKQVQRNVFEEPKQKKD